MMRKPCLHSHFVNQFFVRSHQVLRAAWLLCEPTTRRPYQPSRPAPTEVGSRRDSEANELQTRNRLP